MRRIDLNLFRIFDGIYQEGNLTRAAEVLHITQPAVSNALARLREIYDDPLFVRSGKGMTPTPRAENIAGDVRTALGLLNDSVDASESFDPQTTTRRFRILAGDLAAAMVIPRLSPIFAEFGRTLELDVLPLDRTTLVNDLAAGRADCALDAIPISDQQINVQKILEEDFVCAVRRDHPYPTKRLTLGQYLQMSHAHASSRRRGVGQIDLALRRMGKQRRIVVRTHHHLGLPHIVASSDLAASIPHSLATSFGLKTWRLPFATPASELYALWHRSVDYDSANLWLRNALTIT